MGCINSHPNGVEPLNEQEQPLRQTERAEPQLQLQQQRQERQERQEQLPSSPYQPFTNNAEERETVFNLGRLNVKNPDDHSPLFDGKVETTFVLLYGVAVDVPVILCIFSLWNESDLP